MEMKRDGRKPKPRAPRKGSKKAEGSALPAKKSRGLNKPSPPRASGASSVVVSDPLLQAYMREVARHPILSREEEHELAIRFLETKDRDAFQKLVTSNLRFVVKIAYEYVHYRIKLLDLIQEGNMGLVKAVQEFDPYKEVRLTTYAVWWIRSYIQDSILRNYSLVRMGTTQAQKKLFYRLRAEQARLEREGIAPPDRVKLLASNLDVREKDVREMDQRLGGADLSLDAPISLDEKQSHLQQLPDKDEAVDVKLGENEQRELFRKMLLEFAKTLEGKEKVFFDERLISESPKTLQELGDKYGVSKERARQIEAAIKEKLRKYVAENYPDYDLLMEGRS